MGQVGAGLSGPNVAETRAVIPGGWDLWTNPPFHGWERPPCSEEPKRPGGLLLPVLPACWGLRVGALSLTGVSGRPFLSGLCCVGCVWGSSGVGQRPWCVWVGSPAAFEAGPGIPGGCQGEGLGAVSMEG